MTGKKFSEGAPCAFLDGRGRHDGVILGQEGEDYAWALIFDLKEVIEVCPRQMAADAGMIIFRDYERRRTIKSVLAEPVLGCLQSPLFDGTTKHNEMLGMVKAYSLILGIH